MTVTETVCNHQLGYSGCVVDTEDPVALVIQFLNSLDVEKGTDALASLEGFRTWSWDQPQLAMRNVSEHDRRHAMQFRKALRDAVSGDGAGDPSSVPLQLRLGPDGRAVLSGDDVRGVVASAVAQLSIRGELERVKICPADDCRWAFYDASRNRSRQWCSMAVCGNRAKARTHRARHPGTGSPQSA